MISCKFLLFDHNYSYSKIVLLSISDKFSNFREKETEMRKMPLEEEKHPPEIMETYKSTSNLSIQDLNVKPYKEIDEFENLGENFEYGTRKIELSQKGKSKKSKLAKLLSKLKKKKQLIKQKGNETCQSVFCDQFQNKNITCYTIIFRMDFNQFSL